MSFSASTSISQARQAIEQRVRYWWVTDESKDASYVSWPNAPFVTPTGQVWLQVGVQFGDSQQRTFTTVNSLAERVGVLFLTLFGPKGEGSAALDALASRAMTKFHAQIAGGVEYSNPDGPRDIGDPALASAQITIRFRFWESINPAVSS